MDSYTAKCVLYLSILVAVNLFGLVGSSGTPTTDHINILHVYLVHVIQENQSVKTYVLSK